MRASVCLSALILVLPAVFATGVAQAKIKPIPRPAKAVGGTAAGSRTLVAPIHKPVVHVRKPVVRTAVRKTRAPARTSTRHRLKPAKAHRGHRRARAVA